MPPRALLVTDPAALDALVRSLAHAPRLALDTEGNGMHAYAGRLSAIQLCVALPDAPADEVYVVDPLALGITALGALASVLGDEGPPKVIHDLGFDARMLVRAGLRLGRVVDTSVHARFLGLRETGLGALLRARHEVALSKELQQHDWARRPFSDAELEYLAADVAYLGPLAAGLEREAEERGIRPEIDVETGYALEQACAEEPSGPAWARVAGAQRLAPVERAVLRELFTLREREAERADVPSGRVLSGDSLVKIARERPKSPAQLKRAAHLGERAVIADVLAAVARGEAAGDVPEDERAQLKTAERGPDGAQIAARRAREKALTTWRRAEAESRGVDPQVVLPGHALADVARLRPRTRDELASVPGLGLVRVERYGDAWLALLDRADRGDPGRPP